MQIRTFDGEIMRAPYEADTFDDVRDEHKSAVAMLDAAFDIKGQLKCVGRKMRMLDSHELLYVVYVGSYRG